MAKESLKQNSFLPHFSTVFVILTEPTPRTGPLGVRWSKPGLLKWKQGLKHFCTNLLILAKVSDEVIGPMFKPSFIVGMLDNNSLLKREDRNSRMYTVQIFQIFQHNNCPRWKQRSKQTAVARARVTYRILCMTLQITFAFQKHCHGMGQRTQEVSSTLKPK